MKRFLFFATFIFAMAIFAVPAFADGGLYGAQIFFLDYHDSTGETYDEFPVTSHNMPHGRLVMFRLRVDRSLYDGELTVEVSQDPPGQAISIGTSRGIRNEEDDSWTHYNNRIPPYLDWVWTEVWIAWRPEAGSSFQVTHNITGSLGTQTIVFTINVEQGIWDPGLIMFPGGRWDWTNVPIGGTHTFRFVLDRWGGAYRGPLAITAKNLPRGWKIEPYPIIVPEGSEGASFELTVGPIAWPHFTRTIEFDMEAVSGWPHIAKPRDLFTRVVPVMPEIRRGAVTESWRIGSNDIAVLRNYLAATNPSSFTGINFENSDANADGVVNAADVTTIRNWLNEAGEGDDA
jgi:hypothetical protein